MNNCEENSEVNQTDGCFNTVYEYPIRLPDLTYEHETIYIYMSCILYQIVAPCRISHTSSRVPQAPPGAPAARTAAGTAGGAQLGARSAGGAPDARVGSPLAAGAGRRSGAPGTAR